MIGRPIGRGLKIDRPQKTAKTNCKTARNGGPTAGATGRSGRYVPDKGPADGPAAGPRAGLDTDGRGGAVRTLGYVSDRYDLGRGWNGQPTTCSLAHPAAVRVSGLV